MPEPPGYLLPMRNTSVSFQEAESLRHPDVSPKTLQPLSWLHLLRTDHCSSEDAVPPQLPPPHHTGSTCVIPPPRVCTRATSSAS
ncbi:hypothetical protein cyc_01668 [Cyclospora cayetanensis]|uniref:Uncharacterized protein n=1 Tax=Cyclospora cayetanensis TaxID=88456 RepID=A0A1D3D5D0_9EIME|nr:hypothetical protein cyc_01668 [Cyclospora cayetanensis]